MTDYDPFDEDWDLIAALLCSAGAPQEEIDALPEVGRHWLSRKELRRQRQAIIESMWMMP